MAKRILEVKFIELDQGGWQVKVIGIPGDDVYDNTFPGAVRKFKEKVQAHDETKEFPAGSGAKKAD